MKKFTQLNGKTKLFLTIVVTSAVLLATAGFLLNMYINRDKSENNQAEPSLTLETTNPESYPKSTGTNSEEVKPGELAKLITHRKTIEHRSSDGGTFKTVLEYEAFSDWEITNEPNRTKAFSGEFIPRGTSCETKKISNSDKSAYLLMYDLCYSYGGSDDKSGIPWKPEYKSFKPDKPIVGNDGSYETFYRVKYSSMKFVYYARQGDVDPIRPVLSIFDLYTETGESFRFELVSSMELSAEELQKFDDVVASFKIISR